MDDMLHHHLQVASHAGDTVGQCSCGHWERHVNHQIVALTGRSRQDALRAAHDLHARGLDASA